MLTMHRKTKDLVIFISIILLAALICLLTKTIPFFNSTFFSTLIVLIIPSLYLWYVEKKNYKKIIIGSLVLGALFGSILEFIAELNKDWTIGQLLFNI